jgi:hypothetical protein
MVKSEIPTSGCPRYLKHVDPFNINVDTSTPSTPSTPSTHDQSFPVFMIACELNSTPVVGFLIYYRKRRLFTQFTLQPGKKSFQLANLSFCLCSPMDQSGKWNDNGCKQFERKSSVPGIVSKLIFFEQLQALITDIEHSKTT